MFNRVFKSVAMGILFSASFQAMAQTEVLIKLKGTAELKQYVVEEKGKLFFFNDRLYIDQLASNAPVSYDLNSIQNVRFASVLAGNEMVFSDGEGAFLFPNPATDNFYLANMSEDVVVSVYTMDGALVLRQNYSSEAGVSVSDLPNGLYLVYVGNQTFKLEKK